MVVVHVIEGDLVQIVAPPEVPRHPRLALDVAIAEIAVEQRRAALEAPGPVDARARSGALLPQQVGRLGKVAQHAVWLTGGRETTGTWLRLGGIAGCRPRRLDDCLRGRQRLLRYLNGGRSRLLVLGVRVEQNDLLRLDFLLFLDFLLLNNIIIDGN